MSRLVILVFVFIGLQLSAQTEPNCGCCAENHLAFDFWVGNWQVYKTDGTKAGSNRIVKVQDGCALQENWKSAKGNFTGSSYSFYNASTDQWEQLWIDNQGGQLHLRGGLNGNQMILKSDGFMDQEGRKSYHQITWTNNPDGTVRQFWQTFTEGKDPKIAFDGLYKKTE
ncbi:hypothetical protein [Mangrovimonas futianensis]|uniref:hypothetical protein n=1 Tax=Mangrovimonas futianensis TaxID=2895523 RepID=UPI001E29914A|nr:hypothetical protein [Mangrovimonas futianensis]MCF1421143.1 hypothetical protein [Mangrovimonas futianensis]